MQFIKTVKILRVYSNLDVSKLILRFRSIRNAFSKRQTLRKFLSKTVTFFSFTLATDTYDLIQMSS